MALRWAARFTSPSSTTGANKTFFFGSYEKLNQKVQSAAVSTVMTQAMRSGDFSSLATFDPVTGACTAGICIHSPFNPTAFYPRNQVPASALGTPAAAIAQKYIAYIPAPNVTGITNNLQGNAPSTLYIAQSLDRVDENIGEKVRLFARYHWQNLTFSNGNLVPVVERLRSRQQPQRSIRLHPHHHAPPGERLSLRLQQVRHRTR